MLKRKIVADSTANVLSLSRVDFAAAPLKVISDEREFVDTPELDVQEMLDYFIRYKGKSHTSCPNPTDWLEAFGDADEIFCVAITSALSGSYNAACIAGEMYKADHPHARVHVVDTLSAGPEMTLIVEKLEELVAQGLEFDRVVAAIGEYQKKTDLAFMLESLNNFAANGRVSPAVAKIAGVLGIRIVGRASTEGTLEPTDKCRGEAKSLDTLVKNMCAAGLSKGRVLIHHCRNLAAAEGLKARLEAALPEVKVEIGENRGLCSYYAELGGMLVGFERF